MDMKFETDYARWGISADGKVTCVEDKRAKKNYAVSPAVPFAQLRKTGKDHAATSTRFADGKLTVIFGESGVTATIAVTAHKHYIVFEVLSVTGGQPDELVFANFQLTLSGHDKEPLAACALALNLKTNVWEIPGQNTRLRAICYSKFGFAGAQVALIVCPTARLRDVMKEIVSAAPDLPHSALGGPWALDQPCNRESYFFNYRDLTEQTVDKWIALAQNLGITAIDFHGAFSFRFGDCRPNPTMYPNGRASFKAVIDKLHAAGIKAGLHTYSHFIDAACAWVSPVPRRDLAKDATFTLTSAVGESDETIPVHESTQDMSTVTGFATRNSIVLQIDDELIQYHNIAKEPPYAFTTIERGAFGTRIASHAAGAKAYHLKQCYDRFAPEGGAKLMEEVAAATADFYNECGFDMIYLDALDGADVMGGPGEEWYYGSLFTFEIVKRLKKPAIMEMSTIHHHLWYVRSRMGAWDYPARSYKTVVDLHCESNKSCDRMFLPAHLGWWQTMADPDFQKQTVFPDDLEYLLAKCAAHQCGLSAQEPLTPESYAASDYLRRMAGIYKSWEELRRKGFFNAKQRAILAKPGQDFALTKGAKGKPCLRRVDYAAHKVEGLRHSSATWSVDSRFKAQPTRIRIEGLLTVAPYDSPEAVMIIDFSNPLLFTERAQSAGVKAALRSSDDHIKIGKLSGLFTAEGPALKKGAAAAPGSNQRVVAGVPSYCKIGVKFDPLKDLTDKAALGVWVYGDGQGEMLNIQMMSPIHMASGYCDRYIPIDFTGWRYFELVESGGTRAETLLWPYSRSACAMDRESLPPDSIESQSLWYDLYAMYRNPIFPNSIERLNLWYSLIPAGGTAKCYLSPIKALPIVKTKLVNPAVTVNGKKIVFPTELPSGAWIEYNSPTDCKLYASSGNFVADIKPRGDEPETKAGRNDLSFTCDPPSDGHSVRARVVVISNGPAVTGELGVSDVW
jgi:hypothetical protein